MTSRASKAKTAQRRRPDTFSLNALYTNPNTTGRYDIGQYAVVKLDGGDIFKRLTTTLAEEYINLPVPKLSPISGHVE